LGTKPTTHTKANFSQVVVRIDTTEHDLTGSLGASREKYLMYQGSNLLPSKALKIPQRAIAVFVFRMLPDPYVGEVITEDGVQWRNIQLS
jgi:hypothetical protein